MYIKKRRGPNTVPWGTPEWTGYHCEYAPHLHVVCGSQKVTDPLEDTPVDATVPEFPKEPAMWYNIKGLGKIQHCDIDLPLSVKHRHKVVNR